ncbi:MAG TPA: histidine kinase [Thermoanaerobaculia bacterium]|nr:histidine kinase [Thermoanaerobaculia bacterium]
MKRVAGVLAIWTAVALLFAVQLSNDARYSGHPIGKPQALALALAGWYGWAVLSPLVIMLARRTRRVVLHLPVSVVLTFLKIALTTELLRAAGMSQRAVSLLVNLPVNLAAYWAIAGATWAIDAHVRSSKLEASLAEARLELLRSQIHPHFLFNTLNAIAELMHEDVDAADRMTTRLAELLRASLDTAGRQQVPLRDELDILDRYVSIERVRLGDRLRFEVDVDPHLLDAPVPSFLLQPLVENAIRHAASFISVSVSAGLVIEVRDDGPGFPEAPIPGVGLSNVRERLRQLYGDKARLILNSGPGAVVRIELPA